MPLRDGIELFIKKSKRSSAGEKRGDIRMKNYEFKFKDGAKDEVKCNVKHASKNTASLLLGDEELETLIRVHEVTKHIKDRAVLERIFNYFTERVHRSE